MKKSIVLFFILFLLLLFHNQVLSGASKGLLLWYQILIPSLFPFILITALFIQQNSYLLFARKCYPIFRKRSIDFTILFFGLLCGFPLGGIIANYFVENGCIIKSRAQALLPLCSFASPMFLILYIYEFVLENKVPLFIFLISIYLPPLIAYSFLPKENETHCQYTKLKSQAKKDSDPFSSATHTIVIIGIYVMLFSILNEILLSNIKNHNLYFPIAFLEITNGLKILKQAYYKSNFFLPFIGMLTSFGGLCTMFQLHSIFSFSIKKYLQTKLKLSVSTFLILYIYQYVIDFIPL